MTLEAHTAPEGPSLLRDKVGLRLGATVTIWQKDKKQRVRTERAVRERTTRRGSQLLRAGVTAGEMGFLFEAVGMF